MNRPKRETKAPQRLIEDDEPVAKKPVKKTPPKVKKEKEPVRTLNLDLSDVPPSDDFKFSKDFGEYNNKFWVTYFYKIGRAHV